MTVHSMYRGHPICWTQGGGWVYTDGGEPASVEKPCTCCGELAEPEGPDPCLGRLPGVRAACCGHGNPSEAYIILDDGTGIRGPAAVEVQKVWKVHKLGTDEKVVLTRDMVRLIRTLISHFA